MKKFFGKIIPIVLIISITLMGCSQSSSAPKKESAGEGTSVEKDAIRIALAGSPPTIDVHRAAGRLVQQVGVNIFESLVTVDEKNNVVPMLAKSVEASEDGKTITFVLRDNIKFHNGKELTTDDVVASLNRWKELSEIGRSALSKSTIVAEGDNTVLIVSEEPAGTILSSLATPVNQAAIMPKDIVENAPPQGVKEYIGTGPYKFVEWKQDQYIHMQKFDDYQALDERASGPSGKKEAKIEHLYYYTVPDQSTRMAGLQSGEYDFADQLSYDNYATLVDDTNLVTVISERDYNVIGFNTKRELFQNKKARQAVNAALDMESILMAITGNQKFYDLNFSLVTEGQPWYTEVGKEEYNQKDPEKAKKLLDEAGYNGAPIIIITTRDYDNLYKTAIVLQDQLEKIGMTINVEVYDWPTLTSKAREANSEWDIFPIGLSQNTDPSHTLFLDSRNKFFGTTENPEMDNLLDQYRSALTVKDQQNIFNEIQQLFWEDVPFIKTGDTHTLYAYHKRLKDYRDIQNYPFWNTYIE